MQATLDRDVTLEESTLPRHTLRILALIAIVIVCLLATGYWMLPMASISCTDERRRLADGVIHWQSALMRSRGMALRRKRAIEPDSADTVAYLPWAVSWAR